MIDKFFRFEDTGRVFPITAQLETSVRPDDYSGQRTKEYCVELKIRSLFHVIPEMYELAAAEAQKSIIRLIYKDVLGALTEIRQATYSGERELILKTCQRLENKILEE